jgi:hypothetical protein
MRGVDSKGLSLDHRDTRNKLGTASYDSGNAAERSVRIDVDLGCEVLQPRAVIVNSKEIQEH